MRQTVASECADSPECAAKALARITIKVQTHGARSTLKWDLPPSLVRARRYAEHVQWKWSSFVAALRRARTME